MLCACQEGHQLAQRYVLESSTLSPFLMLLRLSHFSALYLDMVGGSEGIVMTKHAGQRFILTAPQATLYWLHTTSKPSRARVSMLLIALIDP
mmetsp:Transcript_93650/g.151205  ORF Transcript_93650/g.151205 Transcript_93650/m.151205 type:complete len:92 (-) Transcript_93650:459-734(-)